jgi:hypothetical protein
MSCIIKLPMSVPYIPEARIMLSKLLIKDLRRLVVALLVLGASTMCIDYMVKLWRKSSEAKYRELQVNYISSEMPAPQLATGRAWRDAIIEKVFELDPTLTSGAQRTQVDSAGNIYVLGYKRRSINMFSPSGDYLKSFGNTGVDGPDRLDNPTEFVVSRSDSVWVCDPKQKKIVVFGGDGSVINKIIPITAIDRIALAEDRVVTSGGHRGLFELYKYSGEQDIVFGNLIEDQTKSLIALDGCIATDIGGDGFFFGGRYLGVLIRYDLKGKRTFSVQTIDHVVPPKLRMVNNSVSVGDDTPVAIRAISVIDDYLYVLSKYDADSSLIDIYGRRDGRYQFSIKLPVKCHYVTISKDKFYTVGDERVKVWRWRLT